MHNLACLALPGDAFDIDNQQILGRRVAGRSFVQGFASQLGPGDCLPLVTFSENDRQSLSSLITPLLAPGASFSFHNLDASVAHHFGAIHVPDPGLSRWQILRSGYPSHHFSLTGVIHTLCSSEVFAELERICYFPLHSWDALVCTSHAGRNVVESVFNHFYYNLSRRIGVDVQPPNAPHLPVIPLATDSPLPRSDKSRDDLRKFARRQLDIPHTTFVILFVGRISFHSKSHPIALYQAVNRLAQNNESADILLLECGHIYSKAIQESFDQFLSFFPRLKIKRLGGITPATHDEKQLAFAAADVFVSLSDNLQETFGLSVVEAMASSLPTIVSDWNGYKDLVDHGVNGFRVPVTSAFNDENHDFIDTSYSLGLMSYDTMVGLRSLSTVVDHDFVYFSLERLLSYPTIAKTMGINAHHKWSSKFSWPVVVSQYCSLWSYLEHVRSFHSKDSIDTPMPTPIYPQFKSYPTHTFSSTYLSYAPGDHHISPDILYSSMTTHFCQTIMSGKLDKVVSHLKLHNYISLQDLLEIGIPLSRCSSVLALLTKLCIASPS